MMSALETQHHDTSDGDNRLEGGNNHQVMRQTIKPSDDLENLQSVSFQREFSQNHINQHPIQASNTNSTAKQLHQIIIAPSTILSRSSSSSATP